MTKVDGAALTNALNGAGWTTLLTITAPVSGVKSYRAQFAGSAVAGACSLRETVLGVADQSDLYPGADATVQATMDWVIAAGDSSIILEVNVTGSASFAGSWALYDTTPSESAGGLTEEQVSNAVWDELQSGHSTPGTFGAYVNAAISGIGGSTGSGSSSVTINIKVGGLNIENAQVWISTDSAGTSIAAGTMLTNSAGNATFLLDAGVTYYLWMQKDGINPIRGQSFVAVAD